jgi:hypothetical protein
MNRLAVQQGDAPPRVLSEDEFIHEIEQLEASGFAGQVPGPVSIDGLDTEGRVCWHAYYATVRQLTNLKRQLISERAAIAQGRANRRQGP